MAKHYVFPLNGTSILLSVKSPLNPRTHTPNFMASLPNPIGGNSQGGVLATLQAEAAEETRGKVVINANDIAFVVSGNMSFYTSTNYVYNAAHALPAQQLNDIAVASAGWLDTFDQTCRGECAPSLRAACVYCTYLDVHEVALTLLENTGEVATLDLMTVDTSSDQTTANSVHTSVQGIAALGAVTAEFTTSTSLGAIRKLAAWTKFRIPFNTLKAEVALAVVHANARYGPVNTPIAQPELGKFNAAKAQVHLKSLAIAGNVLNNFPTQSITPISLNGDALEAPQLQALLVSFQTTNMLAPPPGIRFGRHAYLKDVVELINQLRIAESLRI